jgi:monoamine oxidase
MLFGNNDGPDPEFRGAIFAQAKGPNHARLKKIAGAREDRRQGPIEADIIVIGAGAAGLAAADELTRAGRSVLVLEARERVGGRCWTRRMPGLDIPVELGAEFIHGEARVTHALLEQAGLGAVESVREQRTLASGRLQPVNAFAEAQQALRVATGLERDLSFDAFLARQRLPAKTKAFARLMVQGFDAADPKRVSARSIAEEWGGGELGASQPRPQGGYGALLGWLANTVLAAGARLCLGAVVKRIEWRRGRVSVGGEFVGERFTAHAKRAIVTVPLGVLQSGPLRFTQKRAALRKLAAGPVIRVAMRFHRAFWEDQAPGVAFFHAPQAPFPTSWTPLPLRGPLLTAWAGGPKAARLTGSSPRKLVRAALASVESLFGKGPRALLAAACAQDWMHDPFSRGGYSYVLVGGMGAREALGAPLDDTVFFAGEATDSEEPGTVAAALRSGQRAAREALG